MNIKKTTIILATIILPLLITACGAGGNDFDKEVAVVVALTQTASALENPPAPPATNAAPVVEVKGDYQPISEQECSNLNAALSQQIGIPGVITSPEPFDDFHNQKTGFGCKVSVTTNGANAIHKQLGSIGTSVLETNGWVEDLMYGAGGIGGSVSGYRKGDQLCLTVSYVEPGDDSLCGADEGFIACLEGLPPEQIRYGFDLNCAGPVP